MASPKKKQSKRKNRQKFASWLARGRKKMRKAINLGKSILGKPKSFLKKKKDNIVSTEPLKDINSVPELMKDINSVTESDKDINSITESDKDINSVTESDKDINSVTESDKDLSVSTKDKVDSRDSSSSDEKNTTN